VTAEAPTTAAPAPTDEPEDGTEERGEPPCVAPADFHRPGARLQIGRLLAPFLTELAITPTELLHNPRHQQVVETHPAFRNALDRAADRQASVLGVTVAQRKVDLDKLIKGVARDTRDRIKRLGPSVIAPGRYQATVDPLCAADGDDATFGPLAALSATLATCRDREARIEMLVSFAEEAEERGLPPVDRLLGEHLAAPGVFRALWHDPECLKDLLDAAIDLHLGETRAGRPTPAVIRSLEGVLARHPMPETHAGLVRAIQGELTTEGRLVPQAAGDLLDQQGLITELLAISELARRLKRPDGFVGGKATTTLLDRRVGLMVSDEKLREIMRGKPVAQKIQDLFGLRAALSAASGTGARMVDEYLLFLLEGRDLVGRLIDSATTPEGRLQAVARVQLQVLTSELPKRKRLDLAASLDSAQHDFLKTTHVLTPLRKERPPLDAIMAVVDLIGAETFTQGKCIKEARDLVRRHVRRREFARQYLESETGATGDGGRTVPIGERLAALGARMQKAGIEFRDLSDTRVLIAEDEESARHFIEMVLRDMGVEHVMAAMDGREAFEMFQDFEDGIDLIVCDWMMPRMNGLDLLKQVRSVRPKLPFLMVTALATLENVEQAMAHDVSAYIAKPFPPEQLEEKVLVLVNRPHLDEALEAKPGKKAGGGSGAAKG